MAQPSSSRIFNSGTLIIDLEDVAYASLESRILWVNFKSGATTLRAHFESAYLADIVFRNLNKQLKDYRNGK